MLALHSNATKMIKILIFLNIVVIAIHLCSTEKATNKRSKRSSYVLPSGWDKIINSVNPSFSCQSKGYFADTANNCQLYHVCESNSPYTKAATFRQHSFICGPGTVFNQLTLTCARSEDSIPCESSEKYFYLNERIGDPNAYFLTSNDLEAPALPKEDEDSEEEDIPEVLTLRAAAPSSFLKDSELDITEDKK